MPKLKQHQIEFERDTGLKYDLFLHSLMDNTNLLRQLRTGHRKLYHDIDFLIATNDIQVLHHVLLDHKKILR